MANGFKIGTFLKSTNTGVPVDQVIDDVGFQPKALILLCNGTTAEGVQADLIFAIGFSSAAGSANQFGMASWSDDAANPSSSSFRRADRALAITLASSGAAAAECDLKSFDSSGFTLTWTTNDANAYIITYIAFGGGDITNVAVHKPTLQTGTGNKSYTGVGFRPDIIFLLHARGTASGSVTGFGFGAGMSSSKRWSLAHCMQTGQTMTNNVNAQTYQRTDSVILVLWASTGAESDRYDLVSMDTDGYTLSQIVQGAPAGANFCALCIKGGNWDLGSWAKSVTTGEETPVSGLSFAPDGVILVTGVNQAASTNVLDDADLSIGGMDGTNQMCAASGQRNIIATVAKADMRTNHALTILATTQTEVQQADYVSLNSGGFTITWAFGNTTSPTILWAAAKLSLPATEFLPRRGSFGQDARLRR